MLLSQGRDVLVVDDQAEGDYASHAAVVYPETLENYVVSLIHMQVIQRAEDGERPIHSRLLSLRLPVRRVCFHGEFGWRYF